MKPLKRPIRASMIIAYSKKLPEDEAAAIGFDEFRTVLMEMGIDYRQVSGIEDRSLSNIREIKGMTYEEAFDYLTALFKSHLERLGADKSVVRALRFE